MLDDKELFSCDVSSSTSTLSIGKRISEISSSIEKYSRKWWRHRAFDLHYPEWDNSDHYVKLGGEIRINPAKMTAIFPPFFVFVPDL